MAHDPLLHYLKLLFQRTLFFVILALLQGLGLWLWLWMHFEVKSMLEALGLLGIAWPLSLDSFHSVLAMGMLWIGAGNTALLYCLLGHWWNRRADVLHRRGSRFFDEREEK